MRQLAVVTWTVLASTLCVTSGMAQESPTTRLQREQNEILRKTERLKELMTRLKERYERDGKPDQVRLLEAGLETALSGRDSRFRDKICTTNG